MQVSLVNAWRGARFEPAPEITKPKEIMADLLRHTGDGLHNKQIRFEMDGEFASALGLKPEEIEYEGVPILRLTEPAAGQWQEHAAHAQQKESR